MERIKISPRDDWQSKVEKVGLTFHTQDNGQPYWDESVYYRFTSQEIDTLEAATNTLQELCLTAGQYIIDNKLYSQMGIPEKAIPLIEKSWNDEPPAIYGRFDLAYDGMSSPKLLEYNADTPTSLIEAAVVQWFWLQDLFPEADQFNSIHDRLIAKWRELFGYIKGNPLYFGYHDIPEDLMTITYLRDTAEQAGIKTYPILMDAIGWDNDKKRFTDNESWPIVSIFKLYPWEWMIHEEFADHLVETYDRMQWIEPPWKMLFSNKGILPVLWKLNPGHPNLLEAYFDGPNGLTEYARKPLLSREGANITIITQKGTQSEPGDYGEEGFIYQALAPIPEIDGFHPVIGSWVIDGESGGMGIRESDGLITGNMSRFVPHLFQ